MIKKIIKLGIIVSYCFTTHAWASIDGWSIGLDVGRAKSSFTAANQDLETFLGAKLGPAKTSTDNTGIGERFNLGYKFNPYFASELGYTNFVNAKIKNVYGVSGANVTIKPSSVDLVGKAIMPFDKFNIFAKMGIASVHVKSDVNSTAKAITTPSGDPDFPNSQNKFRPAYGIGAGLDLNTDVTLTFAWNQIAGAGRVEPLTLVSLGLIYYFGS